MLERYRVHNHTSTGLFAVQARIQLLMARPRLANLSASSHTDNYDAAPPIRPAQRQQQHTRRKSV